VRIPRPEGFLAACGNCATARLMLVFDEVQTGLRGGRASGLATRGRCTPDIMNARQSDLRRPARRRHAGQTDIAPSLRPRMHAATFGGNPISAAPDWPPSK